MKTNFFIRFAATIMLTAMYVGLANAANPQVVKDAPAVTYTVTPVAGSDVSATGYVWTLTGGASGFSASTSNSQIVTWNTLGTNFVLSAKPYSSHNCPGTAQTLTVDVVATLTRNVTWNAAAVNLCSGDAFASSVTVDGGALTSWTFNYTLDLNPAILTSPSMTTLTAAVGALPSLVNTNASNTLDATHTIHIVSFVVDGNSFTPGASVDKTYTVYMVPAVGTIH